MGKVTSKKVPGEVRPKSDGAALVLSESKGVVESFGRPLGFTLIIIALLSRVAIPLGLAAVAAFKLAAHFIG